MAIAFVKSTTGNGTAPPTTTTAFAGSTTSTNAIVVVISDDSGLTTEVTGVTDNKGNTYQPILSAANASTVHLWYCPSIIGGAGHTVTVAWSDTATGRVTVVPQEFSGFTAPPVVDRTQTNLATGTAATSNATVTTTAADELVVGALSRAGTASAMSLGSGFTNLGTVNVANAGVAMESKVVAATGAQTATFTIAASRAYVAAVVTFKAGGANVTATAAAGLGGLAGTAAAVRKVPATAAAALGGLAAAATATRATSGTAQASLGGLAANAVGNVATPGTPAAHTNQTPTNPDVANGAPITLGVRLYTTGGATVSGIAFYAPTTNTGTYTAGLWISNTPDDTATGTLLETGTLASGSVIPGAWNTIPLDTPVALTANTIYTAGVHTSSGRYVSTPTAFAAAITGNGIVLVQSGDDPVGFGVTRNGVFTENATLAFPVSTFGASDYFIDVELDDTATSGTGTASLGGLAATASGVRAVAAAGTANLGGLAATAAAARAVQASAASDLGGLSATAASMRAVNATGAAPLGGLAATAAGMGAVNAAGTATLGNVIGSTAAVRATSAAGTASLGALAATAAGTVGTPPVTGTSAAALGGLAAATTGTRTVTTAGTAPLGGLTCTATARRTVRATAAASLGGLAVHGNAAGATTPATPGRNTATAPTGRSRTGGIQARNRAGTSAAARNKAR